MHALGEVAISIEGRYHCSPSSECIEQCFGLLQVGGIKPLGEPVVDRRQQRAGFGTPSLALPQTTQAHGGAQFEGFCLLLTRHVEGVLKTCLSFVLLPTALGWMALGFA